MRRIASILLALSLCLACVSAMAEEAPFTLAGFEESSVHHDWAASKFFERMEARTGISFSMTQYTDSDQWTRVKEEMLRGEVALPDILFKAELTTQETLDWYEAGKLIDLRPYLETSAPNLWALLQAHPDWLQAITLPDGAIVALPAINDLQNNNAMWINRQWLDDLGLSVPTTAEELYDVLKAFRDRDPNHNGRADEVPLTFLSMWDLKFLAHAFGIVANDYYVYVDESGTVREVLTTDQNRDFLAWLHFLWEEGLLDQDGFLNSSSSRQVTDSDAKMIYGVMFGPTPLTIVPNTALSQYELLMPLTYNGRQVYRDLCGDVIRGAFAVTSVCKDPAAMLSWVDFLYTEEGFRMAQAGLENEDYAWNDDGTWDWVADAQTVANFVLPQVNMTEGGNMPGWSSTAFQMAYAERQAHAAVVALSELKKVSVFPYPLVTLTKEQQARVDEIQLPLSRYAERAMAWFVIGDQELNDTTWQAFCDEVRRLGLDEMVAIWQDALP